MSLEGRLAKLEDELGVRQEPERKRTIIVSYVESAFDDDDKPISGGAICDSHRATVGVDLCEYHFERDEGETLEQFKSRLVAVPWGQKNSTKIVWMWPDGDCDPVPRENAPMVEL